MERDTAAQAIALLLGGVQTNGEGNALVRIARRAGFLWMCSACGKDNYPNQEVCCGNTRPADDWEN